MTRNGIRAGIGTLYAAAVVAAALLAGGTVVAVVAVVGAMVIGAFYQMTRGMSGNDSPQAGARYQARLERRQHRRRR